MDVMIPQTLPETGETGAAGVPPKPFSLLKIKAGKSGGARRALVTLGANNTKLNLNMAHSNFAVAQEEFRDIWNFNPVKEVPLPPGQYKWTPCVSEGDKNIAIPSSEIVKNNITLLKDITNPILASPKALVTLEVTDLFKSKQGDQENSESGISYNATKHETSDNGDPSDSENRQHMPSPSGETIIVSTKSGLTKSQTFITEFFRQQKRKPKYHNDVSQPNTSPKKKLRSIH